MFRLQFRIIHFRRHQEGNQVGSITTRGTRAMPPAGGPPPTGETVWTSSAERHQEEGRPPMIPTGPAWKNGNPPPGWHANGSRHSWPHSGVWRWCQAGRRAWGGAQPRRLKENCPESYKSVNLAAGKGLRIRDPNCQFFITSNLQEPCFSPY